MTHDSRPTTSKRRRRRKTTPAAPAQVFARLRRAYPDAHCALDHRNPFELLAATILSAQCTDVRVNLVTPELFRAYPTPAALATARQKDVEEIIRSTGFFRNKATNLIAMAQSIVADHGGKVPRTMAELHALPGVGRKTANVVLGVAFGVPGFPVDTHVTRLTNRLGLTRSDDPVKIEAEVCAMVPKSAWTELSLRLILHGRRVCLARTPRCERCVLNDICPSAFAAKAGRKSVSKGRARQKPGRVAAP